jgi:hypothetical protein
MEEHKNHTKIFRDLIFEEQAKSITAQINNLGNQIKVHLEYSKTPNETLLKCLGQLSRLIDRLTH